MMVPCVIFFGVTQRTPRDDVYTGSDDTKCGTQMNSEHVLSQVDTKTDIEDILH